MQVCAISIETMNFCVVKLLILEFRNWNNDKTFSLQAHAHLTSIDYCLNGLCQMKSTCSPELARAVTDACTFFVIHGIVTESGEFLEVMIKPFVQNQELFSVFKKGHHIIVIVILRENYRYSLELTVFALNKNKNSI